MILINICWIDIRHSVIQIRREWFPTCPVFLSAEHLNVTTVSSHPWLALGLREKESPFYPTCPWEHWAAGQRRLGRAGAGGQASALWAGLTHRPPLAAAQRLPALRSKAVKGNPRYHPLTQISLSLASAAGHSVQESQKLKKRDFGWGMCGPEASRATPGDEPALMEPRGSVGEKADTEGKKEEERREGREKRRTRDGKAPREERGERVERWMPAVVWESWNTTCECFLRTTCLPLKIRSGVSHNNPIRCVWCATLFYRRGNWGLERFRNSTKEEEAEA